MSIFDPFGLSDLFDPFGFAGKMIGEAEAKMPKVVKDLGCMNGWGRSPVEYEKCMSAGHFPERTPLNSAETINEYYCPICRIVWDVDST